MLLSCSLVGFLQQREGFTDVRQRGAPVRAWGVGKVSAGRLQVLCAGGDRGDRAQPHGCLPAIARAAHTELSCAGQSELEMGFTEGRRNKRIAK